MMKRRIVADNAFCALALASGLVLAALLAGCASTKVSGDPGGISGAIPRPNQVWVYAFSANPADIPADSGLTNADRPAQPPTKEQIAIGNQLGDEIASNLVQEIQAFGMPAAVANANIKPKRNDIVIRGYLISIDQGSRAKRMTIGFGAGGSELTTLVEGYQMTAAGWHKLGSGTVEAGGGKGPGEAVHAAAWAITANPIGLIVSGGLKIYSEASGNATIEGRAKATAREIARQLKARAQAQGWID